MRERIEDYLRPGWTVDLIVIDETATTPKEEHKGTFAAKVESIDEGQDPVARFEVRTDNRERAEQVKDLLAWIAEAKNANLQINVKSQQGGLVVTHGPQIVLEPIEPPEPEKAFAPAMEAATYVVRFAVIVKT